MRVYSFTAWKKTIAAARICKMMNITSVPLSILCIMSALAVTVCAVEPALIPLPEKMTAREGVFALGSATPILADSQSKAPAKYLAQRLNAATGWPFRAKSLGPSTGGAIRLTTRGSDPSLGPEGYELIVTPDSALIRAPAEAGLFYGVESFLQLLPPEVFAARRASRTQWEAPCVEIKDRPRFQWRGLMLDVSRHFFTKQEVERLLDEMAWHKLNVFHWHLVDDQGWRIEIKKYPRLTEVGAWRKAVGFGLDPKATTAYGPDGRYGGYYTQKDIREVVAYARSRHIEIVPEIEMPGHSSSALMAYPQFSCTGGPFTNDMAGGVFNGVYCAGNDASFAFIADVLTEVCALFPGPYINCGGDEVPTDNWKNCAKCQARMRQEGLTNEIDLEGYFIRRVEKILDARHRKLANWAEIRWGGLGVNATLMDWEGGAVEAATAGHDVVMAPMAYCYINQYQSSDHAKEPFSWSGVGDLPLHLAYAFEPIPTNLPALYQSHILGAQACLWSEFVPSFAQAEYMIFPRLCALAEVDWSPKAPRNWDDFLRRARIDCSRLDKLGVNHRALSTSEEEPPVEPRRP
jgi:hexosaminidase